jgi:hypothetical protein
MQRNSREMAAPSTRTTAGFRRVAMRVMQRKSQGIVAVYEQDPTVADAGKRSLVFETPKCCTRVSQFPDGWQRLSDDELVEIQHKADGRTH